MMNKKFLYPNKRKVISLIIISLILLGGSYFLYLDKIGVNECGSACENGWIEPLFPFDGSCMAVCVKKEIPNPLYKIFIKLGAFFLVLTIIYFFGYFKKRKHSKFFVK